MTEIQPTVVVRQEGVTEVISQGDKEADVLVIDFDNISEDDKTAEMDLTFYKNKLLTFCHVNEIYSVLMSIDEILAEIAFYKQEQVEQWSAQAYEKEFDQIDHGLEEGIDYLNRLLETTDVTGIMYADAESARDNLCNARNARQKSIEE